MKCRLSFFAVLFASLMALPAMAGVVGVKSLAGPPAEFDDFRLPSTEETLVPSNFLVLDRASSPAAGQAASTAYSNFSTSPGVGFTLVQVTSNYPYFSPATLTAPNGARFYFNGSTITCQSGPCGSSEANLIMEPFSQSGGGSVAFSISGGEVTGGSWQCAIQDPGSFPFDAAGVTEVDSIIAFDDNVVEVGLPDPCDPARLPAPGVKRPTLCEIPDGDMPQLLLVDGVAPELSVSFRQVSSRRDASRTTASRRLRVSQLQVRVVDTESLQVVHQERFDSERAASLTVDSQGRTLMHLPSLTAGDYSVRLDVEGEVPGVGPIERTAYYFLPVAAKTHVLNGRVRTEVVDSRRLKVQLGIDALAERDTHFYAYAEVWSSDLEKAVAWIGGMTYPEPDANGNLTLPLMLDGRWLALAGTLGSQYSLRHVRIQDPHTFMPLDYQGKLNFEAPDLPAAAYSDAARIAPDDSMRMGAGDVTIPAPDSAVDTTDRGVDPTGILLVHGWCSNPAWPTGDFVNGRIGGTAVFNDAGQSRSHDNFARRIRDQGAANFTDAFSVVAHSQGGAAATHLRAFYTSLLDNSTAPRRIQSMGTPYWGSTLMDYYLATGPLGWLISEIFGFCGPQISLGTLGSAAWRATVPSWAKQDVYYYRTRHRRPSNFWQRLQFWRWRCNLASFVIPGADDGVVADWQGSLSNGHNMGITDSECHVGGMNHVDQKDNAARNDIMDERGRPTPPPPVAPFADCRVRSFWQNGSLVFWADASGSTPGPSGFPISSYTWSLNGTTFPPTSSTSYFPPTAPGGYLIGVTVTDTSGATDDDTCLILSGAQDDSEPSKQSN